MLERTHTASANVNWCNHYGKLKIESPYNPTVPLGHIPRWNYNSKRYMHPYVHKSTVHNSQDMEATEVSVDGWVDKEEVLHIQKGILLSRKKEWNNAVCAGLGKGRKKTNPVAYDITYVRNLSESHSVVSDSLWPHGLYSPWNSPGQNTGVGSLSLLQGTFSTQGLNPSLPHCRQIFTVWAAREAHKIGLNKAYLKIKFHVSKVK